MMIKVRHGIPFRGVVRRVWQELYSEAMIFMTRGGMYYDRHSEVDFAAIFTITPAQLGQAIVFIQTHGGEG